MRIDDRIRKCVVFVGYQMAVGTFRLAGSAFFCGSYQTGVLVPQFWLVTALHVIEGIRATGVARTFLRINLVGGEASWVPVEFDQWISHPSDSSVDVAVAKVGFDGRRVDHLVMQYDIAEGKAQLGDDIAIIGMFRHHHGIKRNIPIVRLGAVASLGEEQVVTAGGPRDLLLIEARSIGGLSGSPVFYMAPLIRKRGKQIELRQGPAEMRLIGLVHGHFDTTDDADSAVNTGIAMVVPLRNINDVISSIPPHDRYHSLTAMPRVDRAME